MDHRPCHRLSLHKGKCFLGHCHTVLFLLTGKQTCSGSLEASQGHSTHGGFELGPAHAPLAFSASSALPCRASYRGTALTSVTFSPASLPEIPLGFHTSIAPQNGFPNLLLSEESSVILMLPSCPVLSSLMSARHVCGRCLCSQPHWLACLMDLIPGPH